MLAVDKLNNTLPAVTLPELAAQKITFNATSAQSAAFNAETRIIQVCATAACRIAVGANPSATANSLYIPANVPLYFGVRAGHKLAVIQESAGGTITIGEFN